MKLKILFVIAGLILSLTLSEFYARQTEIPYSLPNNCFKSDELLNHTHAPFQTCQFITPLWNNMYQISSQGLRDQEYSIEKPDNTFRILVLGDSFTEGWGVDQGQAFPDQLEEILAEKLPDRKIEVLNAGVASYSPVLEYLYLKEKGLEFNPDLVILALDMTDFSDDQEYSKVATHSQDGKPTAVRPFTPGHIQSYVNQLTNPKFNLLAKKSSLARLIFPPKTQDFDLTALYNPDQTSTDQIKKHLLLIRDLLKENQINFFLITYPYFDQLENAQYLNAQNFLVDFSKENNLKFLNLVEAFHIKDYRKLYLWPDPHLSTNGHSLIAQYLADYLIKSAQLTKERVLPQ